MSHLSLGNLFSVTQGGLASGCNADNANANAIQHNQDMISTTQTGAVRCCSFDGESCKSKIPDCSTLSFSKAQQKCSEFRMRLCTEEELSNNICCGTGCSFDLKLVWYTKGNMFCSSIKILMQKPFLNLKSVKNHFSINARLITYFRKFVFHQNYQNTKKRLRDFHFHVFCFCLSCLAQ